MRCTPSQSLSSHVSLISLVRSHVLPFLFIPDHMRWLCQPSADIVLPPGASQAMHFLHFPSDPYFLTTYTFSLFLNLYDVRFPPYSFVSSYHNQGTRSALHQPLKAAVRLSEGSGRKQTNNQHKMTTVVSGGLPLGFWYQTSSRCIVHAFG